MRSAGARDGREQWREVRLSHGRVAFGFCVNAELHVALREAVVLCNGLLVCFSMPSAKMY